jgi:hypothetical protein
MSNRSLSIPSDMSIPELVQHARQFLTAQCEGRQGHVADYSAAANHLQSFVGQVGGDRVHDAVSRAVREMADEGFSMEDLRDFAQDSLKDYKGAVSQMEEVLKHTAVVETYLGEGGSLPAVVPEKAAGFLRRSWACIRPWVQMCRSAGAVSVAVAERAVAERAVGEEADIEPPHDARLVVDDKAPVSAPIDPPAPDHPQEQTQAPQPENTTPTEPTPRASVEQ